MYSVTSARGMTRTVSAQRQEGDGFDERLNLCPLLLCQMRNINSMSMGGGMPWPPTGATQYHAQLGQPDKGGAIK